MILIQAFIKQVEFLHEILTINLKLELKFVV